MAKQTELKEFNPWPSFVDIFSSVILVLLMFLLLIIIMLAYYMQFITKIKTPEEDLFETKTIISQPTYQVKITEIIDPLSPLIKEETPKKINIVEKLDRMKNKDTVSESYSDKIKDREDIYIGLDVSKSHKSKQKIIIKNEVVEILFNQNEVIPNEKTYKKINTSLKSNTPFDKVLVELYETNNAQTTKKQRKKINLGRYINIQNYLKKKIAKKLFPDKQILTQKDWDFVISKIEIKTRKADPKNPNKKNGFIKMTFK